MGRIKRSHYRRFAGERVSRDIWDFSVSHNYLVGFVEL